MFGAGILEGCSHCEDAWRQQHAETSHIERACWTPTVGSLGRVCERGRLKGELEATCRPTCRRRPSDLDIFSISDFQLSRMGQRCKFQRLPSRPMIAELFQPECGVLRSTVCHLSPRHAFGLPDRCHAWYEKTWTPSFDTIGFNGLGVRCHKMQIIRLVSSSSVPGTVCPLICFRPIFQLSAKYLLTSTLLMLLHTVLTSPHHILERVAVGLSRKMCHPELLLRMTACYGRKSINKIVICQGLFPVVNCPARGQTASDFAVPDHQTLLLTPTMTTRAARRHRRELLGPTSGPNVARATSTPAMMARMSVLVQLWTCATVVTSTQRALGCWLRCTLRLSPRFRRRPEAMTSRLGGFFFTNRLLATKQPVRIAPLRARCWQTTIATRKLRLGRDKVGRPKPHLGSLLAVAKVRATCETFGDPCASPVPDDLAAAVSDGHKDMYRNTKCFTRLPATVAV